MKDKIMIAMLLLSTSACAGNEVTMNMVNKEGVGEEIGKISVTDSKYGLVLTPDLHGLSAGLHGFHVHQNPSCDAKEKEGKMTPGLAAGGHLDPAGTNKHGEPWGDGHLGDLPPIYVDASGNASQPVLAPRLKVSDLVGRSLMIHAGGDNHSDHPAPLGGGGPRVACGVVK